jgi:hypothetical protein
MRKATDCLVYRVWPECCFHPAIWIQDVFVDVHEDAEQIVQWRISHESSYREFLATLLSPEKLFEKQAEPSLVATTTCQ